MNYWNKEAQRVLRTMLVKGGVRRKKLVQRLGAVGVATTEAAIANRIYRGTPSLAFVLQVAAAIGVEHLELGPPRQSAPPLSGSQSDQPPLKVSETRPRCGASPPNHGNHYYR